MRVEPRHTIGELEVHARKEKVARVAIRVRAVILAMQGREAAAIAGLLGRSRRAVQQWVQWYNNEGLDALRDAPRPGQPRKLTPAQEAELCAWLERGPDPESGVCALRGPEIRAHIRTHLGVRYSVPGVYALLHRMGFSALRPRPLHRKADPAAQEQFKKDAPLLSTHSAGSTRAKSSRSGTSTKPGSASRAR